MELIIPRYIFSKVPPTNDNLLHQMMHTQTEVKEAVQSLEQGEVELMKMELMDIIHSATTSLYILGCSESEIEEICRRVVKKNEKRGYVDKI